MKVLDPRVMIVPNQNRPGASNVFLNGVDICPWVNSFQVQDEHTPDYTYELNGQRIPFKTTVEIKEIVSGVLEKIKDTEYRDALFDAPLNVEEETYGEHKI